MSSMDKIMRLFLLLCLGLGLNANEICYRLENAYVVAQDEKNTFLGKIESSFFYYDICIFCSAHSHFIIIFLSFFGLHF